MELPSLRDETTWYAIILGSVVGAAVIRTATPAIIRQPVTFFIGTIIKYISPLLVIKLATFIRLYTVFASPDGAIAWLRRHDIVRLWPLKHILILALYWGANFSSLFIFFAGLQDAGKRAGRLSLINLLVLYAGPHLSVLADIVGLAIPTYRRLHASVAATAFSMAVFHVVVASIKHVDPLLSSSKSAFGLIVSLQYQLPRQYHANVKLAITSLTFLSVVFPVLLRLLPYELSLRLHQLVGGILAYACWSHISSVQRFYAYVCAAIFVVICTSQLILLIFPNCLGLCNAEIASDGHVVGIRLHLKRQPLTVPAGKYINIWIPRLTAWRCWSIVQSHPFAVVSWEAGPVDQLELMITPENGWTRHLFEQAQLQGLINCWVFFTGPHGVVANVENYDRILVLASQFGIIPCMPYLQQIKHLLPGNPSSAHLSMESKQSGPSRLKSVHLCWEAQRKFPTRGKRHSPATDNTTPDDAAASGNEKTLQTFDKFLQSFLDDIHFSNRKVGLYFAISENGYQPQSRGIEWSKRAVTEYRRIPLQDVLDDELKKKKAGHKLLVIGM